MKIVYISPHLSTGGLPQYLLKKIQCLEEHEVWCIEYNFISDRYTVQRDQLISILKDRFISLGKQPKERLISLIAEISPDIIHFEEFPETFVSHEMLYKIYSKGRDYLIFETSHGIYFKPESKIFLPDKFIFVSEMQAELYGKMGVSYEIVEYPIDFKDPDKSFKKELGLSGDVKHVLNVGLFTQGKNQKELIEYARALVGEKIQFHFVGNMAINFKEYWEPILKNLPSNCLIWGERSDVDKFYQAADLMVFTSKKETSPLVIREALSWKLPCLIYNLLAYKNMYDKFSGISYLKDGDFKENLKKIKSL
ncbi:MAG: glycosyltransferase family 4 protein [Candidatus Methylopumilus sp.]|nr:glycosyltransferase family 4 protein [Candidatus Methylopumilus sp.]